MGARIAVLLEDIAYDRPFDGAAVFVGKGEIVTVDPETHIALLGLDDYVDVGPGAYVIIHEKEVKHYVSQDTVRPKKGRSQNAYRKRGMAAALAQTAQRQRPKL